MKLLSIHEFHFLLLYNLELGKTDKLREKSNFEFLISCVFLKKININFDDMSVERQNQNNLHINRIFLEQKKSEFLSEITSNIIPKMPS